MSVVKIIDSIVEWAQKEICDPVKLKKPPDGMDNMANNSRYEYELITPTAFPLYLPTTDKLPFKIEAPIPSVVVQMRSGEEQVVGEKGKIDLTMIFSTWSTGEHGDDILIPVEGKPGTFTKMKPEERTVHFDRSAEGWRDAWNWVDLAIRKMKSTMNLNGYRLDPKKPIKYGPVAEQESIPDYYPYWFAWVEFSLEYTITRNNPSLEKFL